ncbi:hypothetical protein D1AOALGA4SA_4495 [Olavius algarvensis Delta 1 endosymbiont]|nr:hypothetical protein D1AOALGA4SA_4495 [Olavius algarvensis Delta 1 endosymbiont]
MFFIKYIQFIFCFEDVVIKIQPPPKTLLESISLISKKYLISVAYSKK